MKTSKVNKIKVTNCATVKELECNMTQFILDDFITPEEVMNVCQGIVYSSYQMKKLAEKLPSEDVFRWCKENNYSVMPAPPTPMSVLSIRKIKFTLFYNKRDQWCVNEKFASEDKTSFGWLLINKTPVKNSTLKALKDQNNLLSNLETVPNAAEMSWFITTYFEVRGVRLFKGIYARTSSVSLSGNRVSIGAFDDEKGFDITDCFYDTTSYYYVGLSAARKLILIS